MSDPSEGAPEAPAWLARELRVVFSRLRRRLREISRSEDLTAAQVSVLTRLDRDGAASGSALAAAERVRPQSMATTLAGLDRLRLVRREPDPGDGRRQLVSLTSEGRAWLAGGRQVREEWLARAFEQRYSAEERRTLAQALTLLDRLSQP